MGTNVVRMGVPPSLAIGRSSSRFKRGVGNSSVPLFLARGGNFRTPQPDQKLTHHDSPHFHGRGGVGGVKIPPQTEHKTMRHNKLIFENLVRVFRPTLLVLLAFEV